MRFSVDIDLLRKRIEPISMLYSGKIEICNEYAMVCLWVEKSELNNYSLIVKGTSHGSIHYEATVPITIKKDDGTVNKKILVNASGFIGLIRKFDESKELLVGIDSEKSVLILKQQNARYELPVIDGGSSEIGRHEFPEVFRNNMSLIPRAIFDVLGTEVSEYVHRDGEIDLFIHDGFIYLQAFHISKTSGIICKLPLHHTLPNMSCSLYHGAFSFLRSLEGDLVFIICDKSIYFGVEQDGKCIGVGDAMLSNTKAKLYWDYSNFIMSETLPVATTQISDLNAALKRIKVIDDLEPTTRPNGGVYVLSFDGEGLVISNDKLRESIPIYYMKNEGVSIEFNGLLDLLLRMFKGKQVTYDNVEIGFGADGKIMITYSFTQTQSERVWEIKRMMCRVREE